MDLQKFSEVNLARCLRWHPAGLHSWSLSDWATALGGEVGEVCEVVDDNPHSLLRVRSQLAGEIGDVYAYADLFAQAAGLNLSNCVVMVIEEMPRGSALRDAVALARHAGKLQDVVKKLNRERDGLGGNKKSAAELRQELVLHLARLVTQLKYLAASQQLTLAECVRTKFNEVSDRVGFPERV